MVDQRLHRLYGSLNDLNEISISADTIQLIVAILKEFISEVVRGSLISKEQELRLKGALKVWKYNQNEVCIAIPPDTLRLITDFSWLDNCRECQGDFEIHGDRPFELERLFCGAGRRGRQ